MYKKAENGQYKPYIIRRSTMRKFSLISYCSRLGSVSCYRNAGNFASKFCFVPDKAHCEDLI